MILLIDNYDSFTYNIAHLITSAGAELTVVRNDAIDPAGAGALHPDGIVISPGPGRPERAGATLGIVKALGASVPILGVCLGHQAIGAAYGARIVRLPEPVHGRASAVRHDRTDLFKGLPLPFEAGRYHSLAVERASMPPCLLVTAEAEDGTVMGLRHASHPARGVQFHPESILTPDGSAIVRNWMDTL